MSTKPTQFKSDMDPVRRALKAWRRTRRARDPIPQPLWKAMAKLARTYGVSRVSQALRVEYYALKRRVPDPAAPSSAAPAFLEVELPAAPVAPAPCVVELEDGCGLKMILRLTHHSQASVLAWTEAFWRGRL